ncbi:ribokinase [Nakamurella sp.]|uniref:ribokinase n=1 Tax=Nakamurella sp. TaxID=1869182 RepID=UPI0037845365
MAGRHRRLGDPANGAPAPSIAVVGSLNMDLIVRSPRLPAPGETVTGSGFSTSPGGKGANQAVAAAHAGGRVRMIGAVGSDEFGTALIGALDDADVDTRLVRRKGGPSGIALITVDDAAENTIVVVAGANAAMSSLDEADRAAIGGADLLVLQLETPLDAVTEAARVAAAAGVPVLLNPSPVRELPAELLAAVHLLVVNEIEAAALGDTRPGGGHLVTTLGAAGARYRGPGGATARAAPPPVTAVDTTGAGDAFTGALAVAWCRGDDPAAALRWACAAGALATTVSGAAAPMAADIDRVAGREPASGPDR